MKHIFMFLLLTVYCLFSPASHAIAPQYKGKVDEAIAIMQECREFLDEGKNIDKVEKDLKDIKEMLLKTAKEAGVNSKDEDIASALRHYKTCMKLLKKYKDSHVTKTTAEAPTPKANLSKEEQAFDRYKGPLQDSYTLIKSMAETKNQDEFLRIAIHSIIIFHQTERIIRDIRENIMSLKDFSFNNPEASKFRLYEKIDELNKVLIPKAKQRIDNTVPLLLAEAKKSLDNVQHQIRINLAIDDLNKIKSIFRDLELIGVNLAQVGGEKQRIIGRADAIYNQLSLQIAAVKMPSDSYEGKDIDDLKELMEESYQKQFPKLTVKKVIITSKDWQKELSPILIDKGKHATAGYFYYINTQVAVKKGSEFIVYLVTFKKPLTMDKKDLLDVIVQPAFYPILYRNL